ncbi:MAG: site-specific DNA-methyltransferase [Planctomycetes bacterium]|nr:site-specific DNA-methyltransferase [Planctomycetota bacterium]
MPAQKPSSLVDTRVVYCGDNLDQLRKLPDACVDLINIDPPFNSNGNYEVFWGETREKRAFEDRHASTQAYIEFMRPRCVELARVLKTTGSFRHQRGCLAGQNPRLKSPLSHANMMVVRGGRSQGRLPRGREYDKAGEAGGPRYVGVGATHPV